MARPVTLLLIGATGLVGRHVLELALADPRVGRVVAPSRRRLADQPGLIAPLVDFERLPEQTDWWQADAVICTLGTTLRVAGSRDAFYRVDHDYPLIAARLARAHGTPAYVLNSAIGANTGSRAFYNRVKGELERDLKAEGFESLIFVRPGVIEGHRDELRLGERILVAALSVMAPLLPRRWRLNPASSIARELLEAAIQPAAGVHVVASDRMT